MTEFAKFAGNNTGYVKRESAADDWAECALDDVDAKSQKDWADAEFNREVIRRGGMVRRPIDPIIHRSQANIDRAAEFGLSADELAERLNNKPGGTNARVADKRFNEIAVELGLDPEDMRARFRDEK